MSRNLQFSQVFVPGLSRHLDLDLEPNGYVLTKQIFGQRDLHRSQINFVLQLSQALETFSAVWESRLVGLGDCEFSALSPSLSAIEQELGETLLKLDGLQK